MKGIRVQMVVLMVMLTWAMLCGINVYGKVQNISADLEVLKTGKTDNASVLMYFPNQSDILTGGDGERAQKLEMSLEAEKIVKDVFTIKVANPVSYQGNDISIVLYAPEMVEFFSGLKKYGIDFEPDPNGCILGSTMFGGLNAGDTVSLNFKKQSANFPVVGHITSPYRRITLSSSSTDPHTGTLFKEGDAVIMLATDKVMEQLSTLARRITYDSNLIIVFTEDSTAEERAALIEAIAPEYLYHPLSEVVNNSERQIAATLKEELAQPIFLAISAAVAYFSIVILTFKKKEKETAILYLCGGSRQKCTAIHFAVFQIYALIPLLINVIFILIWPQIEWNYMPFIMNLAMNGANEELVLALLKMFLLFKSITVNSACLPVAFGYYVCAAVISVIAVTVSMARHTPMTYLRGASQ